MRAPPAALAERRRAVARLGAPDAANRWPPARRWRRARAESERVGPEPAEYARATPHARSTVATALVAGALLRSLGRDEPPDSATAVATVLAPGASYRPPAAPRKRDPLRRR